MFLNKIALPITFLNNIQIRGLHNYECHYSEDKNEGYLVLALATQSSQQIGRTVTL